MRVAGCGLQLRVTKQFADEGEPLSHGYALGGKGMPEIVDPDVIEPGCLSDPTPRPLQVG